MQTQANTHANRLLTETEACEYPIIDKRLRKMRRMVAKQSWAKQKRREDRNPPAGVNKIHGESGISKSNAAIALSNAVMKSGRGELRK